MGRSKTIQKKEFSLQIRSVSMFALTDMFACG